MWAGRTEGVKNVRRGGFFQWGGGSLGDLGRTSGGTDGPQGSGTAALIEVVLRNGFGLGGIEAGGLVEVVREGFLGGLFCLLTVGPHGPHVELSLRGASSGMEERG